MPDGPLVRMTSGGSTGLLEATCRGLRHTLLLFGGAEGRRVQDVDPADALRRFSDVVAVVHVSRHYYLAGPAAAKEKGPAAVPMEALYDDGKVSEAFGLLPPKDSGAAVLECLFLIRPDGYVAVRALGWGLRPVVEYLGALFPERERAK